MPSNNDYDDYVPPPVSFTRKELLIVALLIVILYFEIKYLYVWCKWFTNC